MASAESPVPALDALETYLYPHTVLRKSRAASLDAPVRLRFGGGAAHHHHQSLSPYVQEQERVSNQRRRVRAKRLCAHGRSATQGIHPSRARWPGCTHGDPVRPQAHLLPSLRHGETGPYRMLSHVFTCHRRPERVCGPRRSTPCPCRVFSLSGPETFGPLGCCGGRGPLLPRRPT